MNVQKIGEEQVYQAVQFESEWVGPISAFFSKHDADLERHLDFDPDQKMLTYKGVYVRLGSWFMTDGKNPSVLIDMEDMERLYIQVD